MAYEKVGFEDGNPLFAAELIHIEDGILAVEAALASNSNSVKQNTSDISTLRYRGTTAILEETTLTLTEGDNGMTTQISPAPFVLKTGKTYIVALDGKDYECPASLFGDVVFIGDENFVLDSIWPEHSIGFVVAYSSTENVVMAAVNSTETTHTVAIYQVGGDEESLPPVTTEDEGKVLQVVNGEWKHVSVADSAVKTYIDEYISSALEGDY